MRCSPTPPPRLSWVLGRRRAGIATAALALAMVAGADAAAGADRGARCSFAGPERVLRIVVEPDPAVGGIRSGFAYIAARKQIVYVFAGGGGRRVPCRGPTPTTLNLESVQVSTARRLRSAEVFVDQRRGAFAPGDTDEGDDSPEIEFDLELGGRGLAYFLMMPGNDAVYARDLGTDTIASLNAFEAPFDFDVFIRGGGLVILGMGGDDLLSAAPPPPGPYDQYSPTPPGSGFGIGLLGGAGSDGLFGTPAADALVGGGGTDLVIAGGGDDAVETSDRAVDHVNCGAGRDRLTADGRDRTHGCERRGGLAAVARATRLIPGAAPHHLPLRLRAG